jgi:hypothetical protein
MWVLPTYGRPGRCQDAIDSIVAHGGASPGIIIVDDGDYPAYDDLRLPSGWRVWHRAENNGVCDALNAAFRQWPNEPWYGFFQDDLLARSDNFETPLIAAAGTNGFANSADGWQGDKRMHGAVVFGGDLLRAIGCWAPPGLRHSFVDDAWEVIGRAAGNWKYCPEVMVEDCHAFIDKAPHDEGYTKAYSSFDADRATWFELRKQFIPDAIDRVIKLIAPDDAQARLARARSRSMMIATPVARAPCWQYTLSLVDTCRMLDRHGIAHGRQFVIGSSNLPRARNELCARFLASPCTDLLFVDDDMEWTGNDVMRLLASDKPICGAVGRKRIDKPNGDPNVWCGEPYLESDNRVVQDTMGFVKFRRVGTGFLKIARSAFDQIIAAHPEWKARGNGEMPQLVRDNYYRFFKFSDDEFETGEDFTFCAAWHALGGEIWIDPTIRLGHVGEKNYAGAIAELMQPVPDRSVAAE